MEVQELAAGPVGQQIRDSVFQNTLLSVESFVERHSFSLRSAPEGAAV